MTEITCFKCGLSGHMARDCDDNYAAELGDGDKPPYCGQCERTTRLVFFRRNGIETARRCATCHPSGHLLPVQFKRCKGCKSVVYVWDSQTECGSHLVIGTDFAAKAREKYEAEKAEAERRGKAAPEKRTA